MSTALDKPEEFGNTDTSVSLPEISFHSFDWAPRTHISKKPHVILQNSNFHILEPYLGYNEAHSPAFGRIF